MTGSISSIEGKMSRKTAERNHYHNDRITPEFVLSQYSVVLKTLKDEEVPEARTSLQSLIRQLIYVTPPKHRFFNSFIADFLLLSFKQVSAVEKIKSAFHHLQTYCENLVKLFWKKEVKVIKRYTGLYKSIQDVLPDVDRCMEDMGYMHDQDTDTFKLKPHELLDKEKIMKLGFDFFLTQVIIEFLEDVYCDLKRDGYSWKQVVDGAIHFVGTEQECVKWFGENVVPKSGRLKNGYGMELHLNSGDVRQKISKGKEDDKHVNGKGSNPALKEGADSSFYNVEKWLKDSVDDTHDYHLRQLEHHKEIARQMEMSQQEDALRRQYISMKQHHQPNDVNHLFGDPQKNPTSEGAKITGVPKVSPNMRKKPVQKHVDLTYVDRVKPRDVKRDSSRSSAVKNGLASSSRLLNLDAKNNIDYLRFLKGDPLNLDEDDEEDLYNDSQTQQKHSASKLDLYASSSAGKQRKPARPFSEIYVNPHNVFDDFQRLSVDSKTKANLPDVYSMQGTQEDHMKNSLNALGLESTASSMDWGFDEWKKDYKERDEAMKENAQRDWGNYRNLEHAAQDYLKTNKTDAPIPEVKDLFDFDIPSLDIRRPPQTVNYGIDALDMKLDSNVESDANVPLPKLKKAYPTKGESRQTVPSVHDKPLDPKRPASSRNSVNFPLSDKPLRPGESSTSSKDTRKRTTLASQAAGADLTRPEYAQILKESFHTLGVKALSDIDRPPSRGADRKSASKSMVDDTFKPNRDQLIIDTPLHYNTLPASLSGSTVWKCKACGHMNSNISKHICSSCLNERESGTGKWQCEDCTFLNLEDTDVCGMCNKSQAKGSEKNPLAVGGRECPKCTYINPTDAKKCEICDDPLIVYAVHI